MAESRRIQLTTLSCDVALPSSSSGQTSAPKPTPGVQQEKETRPDFDKVHRLELTLFEPDERCFPEFSYSQLLENKINCSKNEVSLNPFKDGEQREDDEVAAIARKLEEKYGSKPKKKKDRIQDLIDIGYGYDDEDTFIDNSEAYDEFVPASITTKYGGFYINSGVLQFRQVSDSEDLTQDENTPELSKKRKLNGGKEKPKKKSCREDGGMKDVDLESSTPSRVRPDNEMKKKKKKLAAGTLSVTSMLKKFQREKEKERQKSLKASQRAAVIAGVPTIPLCPADAGGGGGSGLTEPLLSLIGSTNDHALIQAANAVDFDIDLDSLLEDSEELSSKMVSQTAVEAPLFIPKYDTVHSEARNAKTTLHVKPHPEQVLPQTGATSAQCVLLPEGLPVGLEGSIRKLMVAAKTLEGESKLKFFTPEINSILLDIELQCREQGGQLRSKVYSHLTSFLPCSRDTILKRVKKLLAAHMEQLSNVDDPVHKLKEAIGKAMPEQITRFHETCQAYEQVKASRAIEEEKEGSQKMNSISEENVEEKGGKKGGPKKVFKWNEEIRECLGNVLRVKMEGCKRERKGSQEMEEHLKTLLDNEMKPLWPKGWMQSSVLIKESRKILGTSLPVKRARPEKKQQQPSICGPPDMSGGCSIVQGSPLQSKEDDVFIVNPDISTASSVEGLKEEAVDVMEVEEKTGGGETVDYVSLNPTRPDGPAVTTPSAPTPSLLDLLADQALAQEQPMSVSHELLAAAVAKYQQSVQHWSFGFDTKSPPFPPPPPQTSPVGFSMSEACQVLMPQVLQMGDFAKHMNTGQAVIISDDSDTTT
ncbi:ubinuclein-1-like [Halichoeres trimaculatus]|uniref:ubinuclein-1-like n=1 Tax=Halichoeres trimaculatus TaxID=147232 RepID=UPI003D9E9F5F